MHGRMGDRENEEKRKFCFLIILKKKKRKIKTGRIRNIWIETKILLNPNLRDQKFYLSKPEKKKNVFIIAITIVFKSKRLNKR